MTETKTEVTADTVECRYRASRYNITITTRDDALLLYNTATGSFQIVLPEHRAGVSALLEGNASASVFGTRSRPRGYRCPDGVDRGGPGSSSARHVRPRMTFH